MKKKNQFLSKIPKNPKNQKIYNYIYYKKNPYLKG